MARTKEESRAYYVANRERILANVKARAAAKAEEIRAYKKQWHAKNRERIKSEKAAKYAANREQILSRMKDSYQADPEPKKARSRAYRRAHPEKCRDATRRWLDGNADTISERHKTKLRTDSAFRERKRLRSKEWYAANAIRLIPYKRAHAQAYRHAHPEKHAEKESRRRARKYQTEVGPIDYKQVLRDSGGVCGICRLPLDLFGTHFDHIVPLAKGGTHTQDNIQASHARCNLSKGARIPA